MDETVPELPLKDVIFRIYRDVRFSKDPTPYKVRFLQAMQYFKGSLDSTTLTLSKPHYSAAW